VTQERFDRSLRNLAICPLAVFTPWAHRRRQGFKSVRPYP